MNKQIEDLVSKCVTCISHQRKNTKEPMIVRDVPEGPWQELGIDLFHFKNSEWLLVIDYFSKYVEVAQLKDTSSFTVIAILKSLFARHGIPKIVNSDNGTQLNSREMKEFAKAWNFISKTSSPRYPQSNGMVEKHIGIVKNMFKKIEVESKDPWLALLEYRNTPITHELESPNELMFNRKTRGLLPIKIDEKNVEKNKLVKCKLEERQSKQKY
ncbi:uncharacterized protein K02A2.6-like [Leptopilina heterotoma]|uniref:uncharacterized protein K02A2.6-like n=1 Tax=Leptopilina heterotoma TaxID=63436 RepID=UPI001CA7BD95|nr:uncharacterized protein K02A2.6-like [Leptopilina heterotoma]